MNDKARALQMAATHFDDPTGAVTRQSLHCT
jgi:D-alanyl-D-alanine carboxypeptidase